MPSLSLPCDFVEDKWDFVLQLIVSVFIQHAQCPMINQSYPKRIQAKDNEETNLQLRCRLQEKMCLYRDYSSL